MGFAAAGGEKNKKQKQKTKGSTGSGTHGMGNQRKPSLAILVVAPKALGVATMEWEIRRTID